MPSYRATKSQTLALLTFRGISTCSDLSDKTLCFLQSCMTQVTQDLKPYHVPRNTTCKKVKVVTRQDKEVNSLEQNTVNTIQKKK